MLPEEFDQICERLIAKIKSRFSLKDFPNRCFLPHGSAKFILADENGLDRFFAFLFDNQIDTKRVLNRLLGLDKGPGLCNIFVTLLFLRGGKPVLKQFIQFIPRAPNAKPQSPFTDENLPIDKATAKTLFPIYDRGADFFDEQFKFCPVVLKKHEEVVCNDYRASCRLPYLEQSFLNSGAYGRVFKVEVERGHFVSEREGSSNPLSRAYARKDFELNREKDFQDERRIIREILRQPKRHENVMYALCSLECQDTFSLFFELADCNLGEYLSSDLETEITGPTTLEEKHAIFRRGVELAGALAFLHDDLILQSDFGKLCCYHLDLKPQNILVVDARKPSEKWMITDFGVSRVKLRTETAAMQRAPTGFGDIHLDRLFKRKTPEKGSAQHSSLTQDKRWEGVYLPPETAIEDGRVGAESDVWSFGCVFSVVMTFIDSGPQGVREFDDFRKHSIGSHPGNQFYVIDRNKPSVNPNVIDWFRKLEESSRKRDPIEGIIFHRTLKFLENSVLIAKREDRKAAKASLLQEELGKISSQFIGGLPNTLRNLPSKPTKDTNLPSFRKRMGYRVRQMLTHSSIPIQKLGISQSMSSTLVSPRGQLLAFSSPTLIELFSVQNIIPGAVNALPTPSYYFDPPGKCQWEGCCLASNYLVAYTKTNHFECQFYSLGSVDSFPISKEKFPDNPTTVRQRTASPIRKMAISPDGVFTACAIATRIEGSHPHNSIEVYLFLTQDLLLSAGDEPLSPIMSLDSAESSRLSFSNTSSLLPPAWKNHLTQRPRLGPIDAVRALTFSIDGRVLSLITEPNQAFDTMGRLEHKATVTCWNTENGKIQAFVQPKSEGLQDSTASLLTTCSLFNTRPDLLLILQHNSIDHHQPQFQDPAKKRRGHRVDCRLYEAVIDDDDNTIFLLGDNGQTKVMRAYSVPTSEITKCEKPLKLAELDLRSFEATRDSAWLSGREDNGQRKLLVATAKGEFLAIPVP
ncbi:hypothetical protein K432DRAFT_406760 [Lepidopterella palustris CBS 459.81]|uniref:Protein kinase domain-containing protein n=1 Tax=Lepidopterella palustris CBS 459.81 TaxID=1314670 RepID=A0A8E2E6B0_9PEZI|nr:hypothetical protein K432DRAFT_406760 [Lepidopterella palustris CBS 459.81]